METIIDYLNHDVLLLIFYFLSDIDKIRFAMVNQFMSQYIYYLKYTDLHAYERVRFLSFRNNFCRLSFRPRYDIIPPVITDLIIDKTFVGSLKNAIPNSVKNLTINLDIYEKNKSFIRKDINILIVNPYIGFKTRKREDIIINYPFINIIQGFNTEDGILFNNNTNAIVQQRISNFTSLYTRIIGKEERISSRLMGKTIKNINTEKPEIKLVLQFLNTGCVPANKSLFDEIKSPIKSQHKYHNRNKTQNKSYHQNKFPRQKFSKFHR
ncbi:putative DNA-directed RNA polymerase subunit 1 inactive-like protein [Cotonvirus japonicus]|uniref:DNA-directed RNA polymerase subunit 1 inactive-like protein n=1 Tax=Cotonvirus japonicus TaxID=2811091 RepID=A0ABM7NRN2_9VIRU|nr:putative DNA-directed RNA polymerase subunit 1 inactive-like protein [Cotonvirus japonicus]BCS82825.1 putative DNA-directed RNA polymerase subunit 1 inactive-like protein [Cotonvirus japonicus]